MTAPSSLNAATLPMLANMNMKDSRWLTLEVCREYQRNRCTRTEEECKFAHPPAHVDQQNGRVMCCFDSIKGKCQRNEPPCKYLHPPQHLKEQLLQNGRQNLALKYHWSQLMAQNQTNYGQYPSPMLPSVGIPPMPGLPMAMDGGARFPLMPSALQSQQFITGNPSYMYQLGMGGGVPGAGLPLQFSQSNSVFDHQVLGAQLPVSSAVGAAPQKAPRADRLEVCADYTSDASSCPHGEAECEKAHPPDYVLTEDNLAVVCMDFVKGKCSRDHCKYYHPTPKLLNKVNQNRQALAAANQANTQAAQALTQALNQAAVAAALQHPSAQLQTQPQLLAMTSQPGSTSQVLGLTTAGIPVYSQASASFNPVLSQGLTAAGLQAYSQLPQAATQAQMQAAQAAQAQVAQVHAAHAAHAQAQAAQAQAAQAAQAQAAQAQVQAAAASTIPASAATSAVSADPSNPQSRKRTREEELLMVQGMTIPMKRPAMDGKGGIPMYQPSYPMAGYPQPTQQPYIPVSFYGYQDMAQPTPYLVAGHTPGLQRL